MTKARDLANAADVLDDVSATELSYVNGVTSSIQTQLNAKQAVVSGVNDTEIGYLDGVTSAIQTQIDSKIGSASAISPTLIDAKGDLIVGSADNTAARLAVGTNNYVLTADSAATNGVKWAAASSGALTLITPTSTANSSGSVSTSGGEVTFTSVSSVSLNGVFSSTYTNYLITVDSLITSTTADILLRWRASGTDTTTNYVSSYHGKPYSTSSGTVDYIGSAFGTTNQYVCDGDGSQKYAFVTTVQSPNQAQYTHHQGLSNTRSAYVTVAGQHQGSTQFDGVTLYTSTGTVSGVIRVYGYSKS